MQIPSRCAALLFAAGVFLAAAPLPVLADNLQQLTPPVPMPAFKLPGLNGNGGSDADLRNKVTVIRFWASW